MKSKRWKSVEGEIARWFGSTRTPLSGGNSKHTRSDTLHKRFFVECKHGEVSVIKTMHNLHKKGYCTLLHSQAIELVMVQYSDIINDVKYKVQSHSQHTYAVGTLYQKTRNYAIDENKVPLVILHLKGMPLKYSLVITEAKYVREISETLISEWRKKISEQSQKSLQFMEQKRREES